MTRYILYVFLAVLCAVACNKQSAPQPSPQSAAPSSALPSASTGGFDGARAFEHVRHLVELGPRPPASDAIRQAQTYIVTQLKNYGCQVEEHDFHGSSVLGELSMKNIIAKIPGPDPGIVFYATHYDTVRIPNFVGADDGGSGTAIMLELARVLCTQKSALNVWIVFFDGEEAQGNWADNNSVQWTADNSTYGSREMAASMALTGDLKRLKAMILADMIGPSNLKIKRDTNSTLWLVDLIWDTAAHLGYANIFINDPYPISGDDHLSFIRRGVPACDIIDFDILNTYWHTSEDTLEKIDPRSLAIVGHVFVETLPALERKFRKR
jgi:glutaminyl-peptide cyclotransferase